MIVERRSMNAASAIVGAMLLGGFCVFVFAKTYDYRVFAILIAYAVLFVATHPLKSITILDEGRGVIIRRFSYLGYLYACWTIQFEEIVSVGARDNADADAFVDIELTNDKFVTIPFDSLRTAKKFAETTRAAVGLHAVEHAFPQIRQN